MEKKLVKLLKKIIECSFCIFVFFLPWQTKLILKPAETNFNEISLYASHLLLFFIIVVFFVYKLKRPNNNRKISWLWWALAGLEMAVLASFFVAPDQVLAFFHYLLFLMGVGVFYLLREETEDSGYDGGCLKKIRIVYIFLASIFLQALLGIYQFLTQSTPICKYLGLAAHNSEIAGTAVIETGSGRWLRVYGGMDHPNIFGGVLAISLILAAYLLAKKKMIRTKQEIGESIFLFVFYFVALLALFFTFSRTAWLAAALGLVVLLVSLLMQKDRWITGRYLALLFFSAIMLAIVAYPYQALLQVRIQGETRLEQKSLNERREYLGQSEGVIREHIFTGVGVGNYPLFLKQTDYSPKESYAYQPVHNVFLLLWAECGIFALFFFAAFLVMMVKKNRHAVFSGAILAALIVIMLFDHWLFSLPFGLLFLFFILGFI
jgi:hypothetical protein